MGMKMGRRIIVALTFVFILVAHQCMSFAPPPTTSSRRTWSKRSSSLGIKSETTKEDNATSSKNKNPLELASWYAVEAYGKVFGSKKSSIVLDRVSENINVDLTKKPSSLEETLIRIKRDNDRSYFLSGEVDGLIYDEKCTFADPFVSFDGRDRFIDNLSNLGSFITNYDAKMIKYDVLNDGREIVTKIMVKLELNLPWKPILAWPWGVTYLIDKDTYLITKHVESWDIEPWKGVQQIFRRPTVKISK
jgi:hypothetical protein